MKITLYVDIVSPFAYVAYKVLRVRSESPFPPLLKRICSLSSAATPIMMAD